MRVSQFYQLGLSQAQLDFVDVQLETDLEVYIDPRALRLFDTDWGHECVHLVQNFFSTVLDTVRSGDRVTGVGLLSQLRQPNETRLGQSSGLPRGRALGPASADEVWDAFTRSEAARTGLLDDLEDSLLMVEGIGPDIVSDITTNVIREPLIRYTQHVAAFYGIQLVPGVDPGPMWNPTVAHWFQRFESVPRPNAQKLLLVPKAIARVRMHYDLGEYYRHHVLTFMQGREIESASNLVHLLKDGSPRVYKNELSRKYGSGKHAAINLTLHNPEILQAYRASKTAQLPVPLSHEGWAAVQDGEDPDWDGMIARLNEMPSGNEHATAFHRLIEGILSALFYPQLAYPKLELEIHEGRKRIDISFANVATSGFFHWLGLHYPSSSIFVECKNYSRDPANEALDQLSGRFSPRRGRVGLLVCRELSDKELMNRRCRDTADDDRGYIVAIDDADVIRLVESAKRGRLSEALSELFGNLIN